MVDEATGAAYGGWRSRGGTALAGGRVNGVEAMHAWGSWKKAFDAWETATARYSEAWLRSPLLLGPAGTLLGAVGRGKATADRIASEVWGSLGLPTRRDQERSLHALNQIQSRLLDLEERLEALGDDRDAPGSRARRAG
jgi:hypothetical protein